MKAEAEKALRTMIVISVYDDESLDVNQTGEKLNNLEWLGSLAGALLGTTTFHRPPCEHDRFAPPAEQEAQP